MFSLSCLRAQLFKIHPGNYMYIVHVLSLSCLRSQLFGNHFGKLDVFKSEVPVIQKSPRQTRFLSSFMPQLFRKDLDKLDIVKFEVPAVQKSPRQLLSFNFMFDAPGGQSPRQLCFLIVHASVQYITQPTIVVFMVGDTAIQQSHTQLQCLLYGSSVTCSIITQKTALLYHTFTASVIQQPLRHHCLSHD